MLIDTPEVFSHLCQRLRHSPPCQLAIDTEFVRETTYWPLWSLLQIATEEEVFVIDVLSMNTPEAFKGWIEIVQDPRILKIFHSGQQDMEIFFHDLGVFPTPIFDCQVAASLCGWRENMGLSPLAQDLLGIDLSKAQQHTDWLARPLSPPQLAYAQKDAQVIYQLGEVLQETLAALGREEWLKEEQSSLFQNVGRYNPNPSALQRLKTPKGLGTESRFLMHRLWEWREHKARALNWNRARVFPNEALLSLVEQMFSDAPQQSEFKAEFCHRYSLDIQDLEAHLSIPLTETSLISSAPRPDNSYEKDLESVKQYRDQCAQDLNLSPSFLLGDKILKKLLIRHGPLPHQWPHSSEGIESLWRWRVFCNREKHTL